MAQVLDIGTYHKYLGFLAQEVTRMMNDGADDDALVRLTAEFNTFKARCLHSDLPEGIKADIGRIHVNYSSKAVARSTWMIFVAIFTLGTWAALLSYARKRERLGLLRDLKTHLEALAMRTKLRY